MKKKAPLIRTTYWLPKKLKGEITNIAKKQEISASQLMRNILESIL